MNMFRVITTLSCSLFITLGTINAQQSGSFNVDGKRIQNADSETGNWMSYGRTYDEQRFSPLTSINDSNVDQLGLAWATSTEVGRGHEASPIVVDGTMFITLPWSKVMALNAKTGEILWRYDPLVPPEAGLDACCDVVNRGAAIWNGKLYFGTIDGRLIALDAQSGKPVWEKQTTDPDQEYTITGAPRVVKGKVIIGNGGAELGVRGYISAYDAETGEQDWRFYTVPGNPEFPFEHDELIEAAKTWNGEWWKAGGGGTAWDSMSYDPDLNLLYVGTGNGSPWNRELRSPGGGDNLYLSSILAINPDNGKLKWHYQVTPSDNWDYTATQHIMLADMAIKGKDRKVLMQAPKNGFFYVLDRETGELLSADAFVPTNWASHIDMESGRPVELDSGDYTFEPKVVYPSPIGGHNWQPMAYSPLTNLVYIPALHESMMYVNDENFKYQKGKWNLGIDFAKMMEIAAQFPDAPPAPRHGFLKAWDPVKQKVAWQVPHVSGVNGGVLATAGNLVFQGTGNGQIAAYSADKGKKLWEQQTNIGIVAPPITYTVDGEQYIGVLAGWGGAPAINGGDADTAATATHFNRPHMLVFKVGGKAKMPTIDQRRFLLVPEPPADNATPAKIKRGEELYHQNCFQCHGTAAVTSGVLADLRYSSKAVHDSFSKIVLDGVLEKSGMVSFKKFLNEEEVDAIHSYLIKRAKEDRAAMIAAGITQ
jgi:quinohemoprotein ethanol dehydrogenase